MRTKEEKRAYDREWYKKNREKIIAANKKRWQEYSEGMVCVPKGI